MSSNQHLRRVLDIVPEWDGDTYSFPGLYSTGYAASLNRRFPDFIFWQKGDPDRGGTGPGRKVRVFYRRRGILDPVVDDSRAVKRKPQRAVRSFAGPIRNWIINGALYPLRYSAEAIAISPTLADDVDQSRALAATFGLSLSLTKDPATNSWIVTALPLG